MRPVGHRRFVRHPWRLGALATAAAFATTAVVVHHLRAESAAAVATASAPMDGFPLPGIAAPGFTLTDQFGKQISLSQFRGKEVVWALIDDKCTTICPFTAQVLTRALDSLSVTQRSRVELVAVNANPTATSVSTVRQWSSAHGMLHRWVFVTGPASQLQQLYSAYRLTDQVVNQGGHTTIVHDSAVLVIDSSGKERYYYNIVSQSSSATLTAEVSGLRDGMMQWLPSAKTTSSSG